MQKHKIIVRPSIVNVATRDANAYCNNNPSLRRLPDMVIQNHYWKSRDRGLLGNVSRLPMGTAFETYAEAFINQFKKLRAN